MKIEVEVPGQIVFCCLVSKRGWTLRLQTAIRECIGEKGGRKCTVCENHAKHFAATNVK